MEDAVRSGDMAAGAFAPLVFRGAQSCAALIEARTPENSIPGRFKFRFACSRISHSISLGPDIFIAHLTMIFPRRLASLIPRVAVAFAGVLPPSGAATGRLDFSFAPLIPAQPIALRNFAGKVILAVNTANQCGYTPQYDGLEKLHQKYKNKGLVIIGIPANDFGAQEPGSNTDIAQFCQANFGVTFHMTEKLATPILQNPVYAQLIKPSGKAPQWNFHKYLISKSGQVLSYPGIVEPMGRELTAAVEAALTAR